MKYLSAARVNLWHQFYEDRDEAFQFRYKMLEEHGHHRIKKFFKIWEQFSFFLDRQFDPVKQKAWQHYRAVKTPHNPY